MKWLRLAALAAVVASTVALGGPIPSGSAQTAPTPEARLLLGPAYDIQRVDSPDPEPGGGLGDGFAIAGDIDRDGKDDVLAPQLRGEGWVYVFSGATGRVIRRLPPPDPSTQGEPPNFGRYVGRLEDIGSCPGGQTSQTCPGPRIGPPDGTPEIIASAGGIDIGGGVDLGRVYVMDGATGAVLKRIEMPPADLAAQTAVPIALRRFNVFGRTVLSPSSPYPANAPRAIKIGDLDGGGQPDVVVGGSGYYEAGPADNPSCNPGPCEGSGRVWFYRGEDIAGSDPNVTLNQAAKTVKNPIAQTDDATQAFDARTEIFGNTLAPVGDVGGCTVDPGAGGICRTANIRATPDGFPEVAVSASRLDFPPGFFDSGAIFLLDGRTGSVLTRFDNPEPQVGAAFGFHVYSQPAIGDVGNTNHPDIFGPGLRQNVAFHGQGRAYLLTGNLTTSSSFLSFSHLDDPTPSLGGNFGSSSAGIGDVWGDPRNEVLVGSYGPFNPGTDLNIINDVHVFSPLTGKALLTLDDPDQQPGSGFGSGVGPLGDVNDDGFIDFVVGATRYDGDAGLNQGRLYIFRSRAAAAAPTPAPGSAGSYRFAAADGGVFAFGDAAFLGSGAAARLAKPIVAMASTPTGRGYWLAGADGAVLAFGDATFLGSTGAARLARPIVAMASTPTGRGYWLVASDGGVFAFGDATFLGSTGPLRLAQPIVAIASTPTGRGYWLAAADGGVFAFGDATFLGSTGSLRLARPMVGITASPSGRGYRLVGSDGGVFAFGDATFLGSTGATRLARPIVGVTRSSTGRGYWLVASDGGVFAFGDARFAGSTGATRLAQPIVAVSSAP